MEKKVTNGTMILVCCLSSLSFNVSEWESIDWELLSIDVCSWDSTCVVVVVVFVEICCCDSVILPVAFVWEWWVLCVWVSIYVKEYQEAPLCACLYECEYQRDKYFYMYVWRWVSICFQYEDCWRDNLFEWNERIRIACPVCLSVAERCDVCVAEYSVRVCLSCHINIHIIKSTIENIKSSLV